MTMSTAEYICTLIVCGARDLGFIRFIDDYRVIIDSSISCSGLPETPAFLGSIRISGGTIRPPAGHPQGKPRF